MFNLLPVFPIIINTLIVSVPEGVYFVLFSLIFMRRFDLMELRKSNIISIIIITLPVAIISNILRSLYNFDMNIGFVVGYFGMIVMIVLCYRIKTLKGILKTILSVTLSFIVAMGIQLLYVPLILYGTSISMDTLNEFSPLSYIISLIDRVMQAGIISVLLLNKKKIMKLNIFKVLARNKSLGLVAGFVVILNLIFVYIMCILVYFEKILMNLNPLMQILTVVTIVLFPITNTSIVLVLINYFVNKHIKAKLYMKDEFRAMKIWIEILLKKKMYNDIYNELNSFENQVKNII